MGFGFPLLSDPNREVADLLDARRPPLHPMAALPRRITYLIDPEGIVARSYDVGRHIKGHGQEVLEDLRSLAPG
jgi:peroxiredoxin Q/BCP